VDKTEPGHRIDPRSYITNLCRESVKDWSLDMDIEEDSLDELNDETTDGPDGYIFNHSSKVPKYCLKDFLVCPRKTHRQCKADRRSTSKLGAGVDVMLAVSSKPIFKFGKGQAIYTKDMAEDFVKLSVEDINVTTDCGQRRNLAIKLPNAEVKRNFILGNEMIDSSNTKFESNYPEIKGFCLKLCNPSISYDRLREDCGDRFREGLSLPRKFLVDLTKRIVVRSGSEFDQQVNGNVEVLCEEIETFLDGFVACEAELTHFR